MSVKTSTRRQAKSAQGPCLCLRVQAAYPSHNFLYTQKFREYLLAEVWIDFHYINILTPTNSGCFRPFNTQPSVFPAQILITNPSM